MLFSISREQQDESSLERYFEISNICKITLLHVFFTNRKRFSDKGNDHNSCIKDRETDIKIGKVTSQDHPPARTDATQIS